MPDMPLRLPVEPRKLRIFPVERLHDLHPGDPLDEHARDALHLPVHRARGEADAHVQVRESQVIDRQYPQRQPGQRMIERKQKGRREHDHNHIERHVDHVRTDQVLRAVDVARQPRHDAADLAAVVKRLRQLLDMLVQLTANAGRHPAAHAGRHIVANEADGHARGVQRREHDDDFFHRPARFFGAEHVVDPYFRQPRGGQRHDELHQAQCDNDEQIVPVRLDEPQIAADEPELAFPGTFRGQRHHTHFGRPPSSRSFASLFGTHLL